MRKRLDFVTNSSTCSFLIVGWELHKSQLPDKYKDEDGYFDWERTMDDQERLHIEVMLGREMGAKDDDHMIVGVDWGGGDIEDDTKEIAMKDLLEVQNNGEIRELFGIPNGVDASVFFGIRMC